MKDLKFKAKYLAKSLNLRKGKSEVVERHEKLKSEYDRDPSLAMITDYAVVNGSNLSDPFRSEVLLNAELKTPLKTGLHKRVGGDHDYPNPGDILCASLATCMESTIRMIADRLEIVLTHTKVEVKAQVDVRGTLMFDKSVPVGFQNMTMNVELGSANVTDKILTTLFRAAKKSCVVYQTLKPCLKIENGLEVVQQP